jgi:histone H3/H4
VLAETGRMYAYAEDALRRALERNLAGLWQSAVQVAQEDRRRAWRWY